MGRSTKDAWLDGPGDLREAEVEDVPVPGESVRVRGLAAGYSNEARSEATELKQVGRDQIVSVNAARLEVLQFAHGVIEPQFTVAEAEQISRKFGPAFRKVVDKIDELSGLDKEAITEAEARFPGGGTSANGSDLDVADATGDPGSDLPARAGAGTRPAGRGDVRTDDGP
jgi:hypothetical protein